MGRVFAVRMETPFGALLGGVDPPGGRLRGTRPAGPPISRSLTWASYRPGGRDRAARRRAGASMAPAPQTVWSDYGLLTVPPLVIVSADVS